MSKKNKSSLSLTKTENIHVDKINVFFKKSILKSILKILTMEHNGFRNIKTVKNINRLFTNMDLRKYKNSPELESYIWCINYISKQWLEGIVNIDLIAEMAKRHSEYDNIKEDIINKSILDPIIITHPEAKMIFELIGEALQFGYLISMKDEYINLLEDINTDDPSSYKQVAERLFGISQSLLDIKHNTNLVANKVTFNTADIDTIKNAVLPTMDSLQASNNIFKTGIRRLNTLLSPGYMNGRIYTYLGLPGTYKSGILLKSALDIRKYNPDFITKTPGMKPCILYITMENTFTETIERIWNMTFDDSITNYSVDEAIEKLSFELGITRIIKDDVEVKIDGESKLAKLLNPINEENNVNIEIVMKYFSYREINTDDIFTIIHDLRDENMEVCAVVFDYLKRIRPNIPIADNVRLELDRIINEFKSIAVICDIPFITAHQLNRAAAAIVDNAIRQGKGDVTKLVGRENTGDSWSIMETSDWVGLLNIEYKTGTDEKFLIINALKRRRLDNNEYALARYTYLAHPFSKNNGLRLIDDINLDKVLSLQSLTSDIDIVGKEKSNATPRLINMENKEFIEIEDDEI